MIELNIAKTNQMEVKRRVEYELVNQDDLKDMVFIVIRDENKIVIVDESKAVGHIELGNQYVNNENIVKQFSRNIIEYDGCKDVLSSKINYVIENYLLTTTC